jgi:hypothetical protein
MRIAIELVEGYGLWVLLGAAFLTLHWFGTRCCGGRYGKDGRVRTIVDSRDDTSEKGSGA